MTPHTAKRFRMALLINFFINNHIAQDKALDVCACVLLVYTGDVLSQVRNSPEGVRMYCPSDNPKK
jgi:hypothetical protein